MSIVSPLSHASPCQANPQTLRYRSKLGTSRANFKHTDDLAVVHDTIASALSSIAKSTLQVADNPSGPFRALVTLHGKSIQEIGLKHGDMLFLKFDDDNDNAIATPITSTHGNKRLHDEWKTVVQMPIDTLLEKQSGKIPRQRNTMCKHGPKGMCDYCTPLERTPLNYVSSLMTAFDASYLDEQKIKHSSFHAYLKKINSVTNKPELNASFIPPLTETNVRVDKHCTTGHAPWPGGICSKCQPSAITLQRQEFRMIDHLEFADSRIVDAFLNFWRKSGNQRFGYLYGRYDAYTSVPLGQKAIVEAIYEPPQVGQADGIELQDWENEASVESMAAQCGLHRVGIIFTDLTDDGSGKGSVLAKRHIDSFFLSSLEASLSASFQIAHPNVTHWSATGKFGSKFLTAVVSGSLDGQIEVQPYQISEQGVAMFDAGIIEPSADPNTILVCQEGDKTYIPEVFYSKINEYNRQVKENAKPAFPMEYLLVTLTHGFPKEPIPLFQQITFPIENRAAVGESADLNAIAKQLNIGSETSMSAISDFHLLLYLISLDILPTAELDLLIRAATQHDADAGAKLVESDSWATLLAILSESAGTRNTSEKRAYTDNGSVKVLISNNG